MDRDEVDNVARHTTVGSGGGLVGGKINRMQDITEEFILLGWKEPKISIRHPFELRIVRKAGHQCGALAAAARGQPGEREAGVGDDSGVTFRDRDQARIAVMENIDIIGIARAITVEGNPAGHVAVSAALACKKPQQPGLKITEGHGTDVRSAQRGGAPPSSRRCAERR